MAEAKRQILANPAAPEIFADAPSSVSVRGNVARVTFVSDRVKVEAGDPDAVVAGHVAMSIRGFLKLYGQMDSIIQQMRKSGLIKPVVKSPESAPSAPRKPASKKPAAGKSRKPKSRKKK